MILAYSSLSLLFLSSLSFVAFVCVDKRSLLLLAVFKCVNAHIPTMWIVMIMIWTLTHIVNGCLWNRPNKRLHAQPCIAITHCPLPYTLNHTRHCLTILIIICYVCSCSWWYEHGYENDGIWWLNNWKPKIKQRTTHRRSIIQPFVSSSSSDLLLFIGWPSSIRQPSFSLRHTAALHTPSVSVVPLLRLLACPPSLSSSWHCCSWLPIHPVRCVGVTWTMDTTRQLLRLGQHHRHGHHSHSSTTLTIIMLMAMLLTIMLSSSSHHQYVAADVIINVNDMAGNVTECMMESLCGAHGTCMEGSTNDTHVCDCDIQWTGDTCSCKHHHYISIIHASVASLWFMLRFSFFIACADDYYPANNCTICMYSLPFVVFKSC